MTTTRTAVIRNLGVRMRTVRHGISTNGGAGSLLDTSADSPLRKSDDAARYVGATLYIDDGEATVGGQERLVSAYAPSTQTLTTDAFGAALSSDLEYELHFDLPRLEKNTLLNLLLTRRLLHWQTQPLSLVTDGDMEGSDATAWTAINNATLTKTGGVGPLHHGGRLLSLQTSTTADEACTARSTMVYVSPGQTVSGRVWAQVNNAAAVWLAVQGYDSAVTETELDRSDVLSAGTGGDWRLLEVQVTVPDDHYFLRFDLVATGDGNARIAFFDDLVVWRHGEVRYPVPSWIEDASHFDWVYTLSDHRYPGQARYEEVPYCKLYLDPTDSGGGFVQVTDDVASGPLYVRGVQHYDALSSDSATTAAPAEWLEAELAVELLNTLADPQRYDTAAIEALLQRRWLPELESVRSLYEPRLPKRLQSSFVEGW